MSLPPGCAQPIFISAPLLFIAEKPQRGGATRANGKSASASRRARGNGHNEHWRLFIPRLVLPFSPFPRPASPFFPIRRGYFDTSTTDDSLACLPLDTDTHPAHSLILF